MTTNESGNPIVRRKLHRRLRWLAIMAVVVGATGIAATNYVRSRLAALPPLRTVPVEHRDLRITVGATGTIEPEEIVEVGASVSGRIIHFGRDPNATEKPIDVGSRVSAGDVLLQLESERYELGLRKAQAARRLAEADIGRLEAQRDQADRDLQRARRLRDTNSQSAYDKAETAYAMAVAELAIARARLEQAAAGEQQASIDMARTTIRSPIDGVVIDRRANVGQNVATGTAGLFLLAKNLDGMQIRASVNETDIGKVTLGQPVTFSVDAHRDVQMSGRVEKILLNARVQGGFVTYDVLVAIDEQTVTLLPYMTADVEFEILKREQAWLVPTEALKWWPSQQRVAAKFDDVAKRDPATDPQALQQGDVAFVWATQEGEHVRPVKVRIGVNDGVLTEVIGDGMEEQMPVAVGIVKQSKLARIIPSAKTLR